MEHLFNCHGEWTALLAILPQIPIFGGLALFTIRRWFGHTHEECPSTKEDG